MNLSRSLALLSLTCALAAGMLAQAPPQLSALPSGDFKFTGNWSCEGAFGNHKVHRSTFTGAVVLGGKWLELAEEDVEPATGYVAKYLIGYDSQARQIVEFDANNFGAATYSSVEGWRAGVLTMTSAVSTDSKVPYAANRFIYTTVGQDTFLVDWQVSRTATLNWVGADHLVCKRN